MLKHLKHPPRFTPYRIDIIELAAKLNEHSPLLTTKEAAAYLNLSVRLLERWRAAGYGPPIVKMCYEYRYRMADINAFALSCSLHHPRNHVAERYTHPEVRRTIERVNGAQKSTKKKMPFWLVDEPEVVPLANAAD